MKTISISQLFDAVHMALYNTTHNDELQKPLSVYGFTPKRMQEGKGLLEHARLKHHTQEQRYHDARQLMRQIDTDCEQALEAFREHVAIARIAFRKEPHILQELKIKKIASSKWACVQQAMNFYEKTGAYMEKLQQYGATEAAFQQNKAAVEALVALKAQRLKKKGDAENSTEERNESIQALRAWYGEFRKIARIAFQDTPQVLETFGIKVPSSKRKTKATAQV